MLLFLPELQVLQFEQQYLDALPCAQMYEKSYMHRDTVTHVVVSMHNSSSRYMQQGTLEPKLRTQPRISWWVCTPAAAGSAQELCAARGATVQQCDTVTDRGQMASVLAASGQAGQQYSGLAQTAPNTTCASGHTSQHWWPPAQARLQLLQGANRACRSSGLRTPVFVQLPAQEVQDFQL